MSTCQSVQTVNKITQQIPKKVNYGKKNIRSKTPKNISYLEVRKFIENSLATTTYVNIAKLTNNSTPNQGMMTHFDMINLIKELKILLELLRESLTNLTTKPHAEPDPKKNFHPHSNKTDNPKKQTNQTKNFRHPSHHYKTQQSPTKKLDNTESLPPTPKKSCPVSWGCRIH